MRSPPAILAAAMPAFLLRCIPVKERQLGGRNGAATLSSRALILGAKRPEHGRSAPKISATGGGA